MPPSRALEAEFRYVIRQAMQSGDYDRAQQARETAFERWDIDLLDYLVHPSLGKAA